MISEEEMEILLQEAWDYVDISFPNEIDKMQVSIWLTMFLELLKEPYHAHILKEGVFLFPNPYKINGKNFIEMLRITANLLEKMGGHKKVNPS